MKFILVIAVLAFFSLIALVVVIALYHHKKTSAGEVRLIGELCQVKSSLNPDGTVVLQGELWRARSIEGTPIAAPALVCIVGAQDHLLLVRLAD